MSDDILRGFNILVRVLTFAKPECHNVLQPSLIRGSGCNTLSHSGLANVNIRKGKLYTFLSSTSSSK